MEWRRFERERNEWEIEKADLKASAKVSFLEGERRGMENLKTDLMRRVKMLEYALRLERGKYLSLQSNTGAEPSADNANIPDALAGAAAPNVNATTSAPTGVTPGTGIGAAISADKNNGVQAGPGSTSALPAGGTLLGYSKGVGNIRSKEILKNYLREANYLLAHSGLATSSSVFFTQNSVPMRIQSPNGDDYNMDNSGEGYMNQNGRIAPGSGMGTEQSGAG
ncbi:hypothetical protein HDU76_013565, partial [Blyttiomyces sp. JEL0837]